MRVSADTLLLGILIGVFMFLGWKLYEVFKADEKEGFAVQGGTTSAGIVMTSCPVDSESFIDSQGRTLCCLGKVADNQCQGQVICSLSESTGGMPTCTQWQLATMRERGATRCPNNMPFYFESADGTKGCTAGPINATGTGPLNDSVKMCKKYSTQEDEKTKQDSCTNAEKIQQFLQTLSK
jgi:hypothetical protein